MYIYFVAFRGREKEGKDLIESDCILEMETKITDINILQAAKKVLREASGLDQLAVTSLSLIDTNDK